MYSMGLFFCKSPRFSFVVFSFLSFISFCFSLSTVTISETDNITIVCAIVPNQYTLNCSSFPFPGNITTPFNPNDSFSGIVSGDGFICGLRSFFSSSSNTSIMHCWRSLSKKNNTTKRIYMGPVLSQLEASNSQICGLKETKALQCWQWPEFNQTGNHNFTSIAVGDGFVCGLSEVGKITCPGNFAGISGKEPPGNYIALAAGYGHACAIRFDNELKCWGNSNMGNEPTGKFNAVALGLNRSCALRTDQTVVCWGQDGFRLPLELKNHIFITIKAKRNVFCGVSASNYSLFCWGGTNSNSSSMVFSTVLPGPCTNTSCGSGCVLPGSGLLCTNGRSICQNNYNIPYNRDTSSDLNGGMVAFLVVGCVGSLSGLLVIGFFLFRYCKCRGCRVHDSGRLELAETGAAANDVSNQPQAPIAPPVLEKRLSQLTSMGNTGRLEEFSLEALLLVTDNFSEEHRIGTGSFGSVYHAILGDGCEVAIKRAEIASCSSYAIVTKRLEDKDNAFVNELEYLSRLHHKNLVRLLGFCEDSNERVLVYEFMSNGTLHDHLHRYECSPFMSWAIRIKIALDAARGIEYLHQYAVPPIIHRDIKSSNILLDANWTAKVSDFGLSLIGPGDDESHISLRAAGTVGYIDPEYYRLQQLTTKSDVYSFGVVLLELLSGYKAIHQNENGAARNVVDFVVPYILRDEIHRVLDPRVPLPTPFEIEAVAYVGYLAADCVRPEGRCRPSMTDIIDYLEKALAACFLTPVFSRSTTNSST